MNIADALRSASQRLDTAGVANPRREAASLLALALDKPNTFLIAHPEYELSVDETSKFESFTTRREKREPFQYIAGRQEFYGLDFEVTSAVLIPRPETEILVEEAIKELQNLDNPRFCEIGVGSGCISVSILANIPTATAVATDISAEAINVARRNAEHHNVADRLTLVEGDLFANVRGKFDMIVSNPPYVPDGDFAEMQIEVRDYEPDKALFAGIDGLDVVKRLIDEAPEHLKSGSGLWIEIGIKQSYQLSQVFDETVWLEMQFLSDLQGIHRISMARLR